VIEEKKWQKQKADYEAKIAVLDRGEQVLVFPTNINQKIPFLGIPCITSDSPPLEMAS
jgi:hypothetical protein